MDNKKHLIPAKKGEVRNPNGRPKGSKNKSTIFKEMLASKLNGNLTVQEELITKLYEAMKDGDLKAIDLILNGAYGKDKQVVEQTNIELSAPPKITFDKDE